MNAKQRRFDTLRVYEQQKKEVIEMRRRQGHSRQESENRRKGEEHNLERVESGRHKHHLPE